ncbi:MAG: hypothetical protein AB2L20_12085 [Mangrovibacterium sp.]
MILPHLGFSPDTVIAFWEHFQELPTGEVIFPGSLLRVNPNTYPERVFPDGTVSTPSEFFLEYRSHDFPCLQVYLFASVLELMAFYQLFQSRASLPAAALVVAGSRPGFEFVQSIKARYAEARFILVKGHTFFDRIWDIRLACQLDGLEPAIRMGNCKVHIRAGRFVAEMFPELLSLSRFCRLSGYRTAVRTLKPKGFNSYVEMIRPVAAFNPLNP